MKILTILLSLLLITTNAFAEWKFYDLSKAGGMQYYDNSSISRNGDKVKVMHYDSSKLDCEFCNQFLAMSGINYSNSQETIGQMIKNISIGLLVILVLYFIFK